MKFELYKSVTKFSYINVVFWCALGLALLLVPTSALGGAFYMIAIYFIMLGASRLVDAIIGKAKNGSYRMTGFIVGILLMIAGTVSLFSSRYLLPMTPLYVAAVLAITSVMSVILAICSPREGAKGLRFAIAVFACIASVVAIAFSFGFGVDGTNGFARIAGISSILLGAYSTMIYLRGKKHTAFDARSGGKQ